MAHDSIIWADSVSEPVKTWVVEFFTTADTPGDDSAKRFADLFHQKARMEAMGGPLSGRKGAPSSSGLLLRHTLSTILPADLKSTSDIYQSRVHAWDTVKARKHVLHKVYSLSRTCDDVVILGSLQCELKNGRSFEMEFAAQVIFASTNSDRIEAQDYKIWADRRPALEAAKAQ